MHLPPRRPFAAAMGTVVVVLLVLAVARTVPIAAADGDLPKGGASGDVGEAPSSPLPSSPVEGGDAGGNEEEKKGRSVPVRGEPGERRARMRERWSRTFEEIRSSNPAALTMSSRSKISDRWKRFLDSGGATSLLEEGPSGGEPATRFDGSQTWDRQLQMWADEVSAYLAETRSESHEWIDDLLKPRERSGYSMSNFGVPSESLRFMATVRRAMGGEETAVTTKATTTATTMATTMMNGAGAASETAPADGGARSVQAVEPATLEDGNIVEIGENRKNEATTAAGPRAPLAHVPPFDRPFAFTALEPDLPPLPRPRPVAPGESVVPSTDVSDKSKNVFIVTTAAIPWTTGTAVNPMLRAAYLSSGRREAGGSVTIMLPWVERRADMERVYGKENMFDSAEDQERYIRTWLRDTANMREASEELRIRWYTAWQEIAENSLYSMGDIIGLISEDECDICVLEEPEHLNWYRAPGDSWTRKFKHVIGIVHTNYFVYAQEQPAALIRAPGMRLLTSWMCRAHCHRLIKLSGTLDEFAPEKELVENVHGVRQTFLDVGEELRSKLSLSTTKATEDAVFGPDAPPTVYFIGKMLWSKGLASLMELVKYAEESAGLRVQVDMYGGGPNKDEAMEKSTKMGLDMPFHGPLDHAELGWTHKVFVNPSTSEVLCTTVAEALAMGKFVVLPSHPSNDFFAQFPNCLPYANKEEFVGNLYYALTHSPEPLTEEYSYALSWEAATERFAAAGSVSVAEANATKEALSSADAGLDIALPPLVESEKTRKQITRSLRRTRERYRSFRSMLSQEISENNFLPKDLQQRLITDLDKRLNIDLDEFLASPKLRVKLSPAKLDEMLLELYDGVSEGPRGDVLRMIGGGANVGGQYLFMQRQREKAMKIGDEFERPMHLDSDSDIIDVAEDLTPTSVVKRALNRNLPFNGQKQHAIADTKKNRTEQKGPTMSLHRGRSKSKVENSWRMRMVCHGSFTRCHVPSRSRFSALI